MRNNEHMLEKPLTTGEIAEFCHVTYRCVLMWIEEGKIKSYKTPGGHNRVCGEDFLGFLKDHNMPVPEELRGIVRKKKILIVDDDDNVIRSVQRVLKMEKGYEVETAVDGFDAGRKIVEFDPDMVLLDIRMPGMDGYEVARRIKQMPEGAKIKIIAISAYFKEEGRQTILSIGADACMDKPFNNEQLVEKIRDILNQ
jgi:excisionase family DNA binding protein